MSVALAKPFAAAEATVQPYAQLAGAIMGAGPADDLYELLWREFADVSRGDVYFAITLAWRLMQADLLAAEAEARHLRRQMQGVA